MQQKEATWNEREAELRTAIEDFPNRLREEIAQERKRLEKESVRKAKEAVSLEVKDLQTQILEKDQRLKESEATELALRKRERALEDEKRAFDLKVSRLLSEERVKVEEETSKRILDEQRFKDAEKDKRLQDAIKANEELRRKLEQGSQQTQGEVMELELEALLKATFPLDDIRPVPKGINGADVLHHISTKRGTDCGCIIWESKRTKNWSEGWIAKLKDDQRAAKADIAVLVTEALPRDVRLFALKDGVWVTSYSAAPGLALALRDSLIQVAYAKMAVAAKDEKMEMLFSYLTGLEFRQRVEVLIETFQTMQQDLDKEKRVYEKNWAQREKQIVRVVANAAGMYGDMQGLLGPSMQPIQALEAGHDNEDVPDAEPQVKDDLPF